MPRIGETPVRGSSFPYVRNRQIIRFHAHWDRTSCTEKGD